MANEVVFRPAASNDYFIEQPGTLPDTTGFIGFGYNKDGLGSTSGTISSAVRFRNVAIDQGTTVSSAYIRFHLGSVRPTSGDANIYFRVNGIDEDNTGDFGSNPMGRAETSAVNNAWWGSPASNTWDSIDVTSMVNEIVARGGWQSGNAMAFKFHDRGTATDTNRYVIDAYDGTDAYLVIRVSPEPNFKPTPKSVAAPTFPPTDDCGIRISAPGKDVLTATDEDIWFTTRKHTFGVFREDEVTITTSPQDVTHNLGYTPAVLAYANYSGKKYRFPDFVNLSSGGLIESNQSKVRLYTNADKVYYYIFIDPVELV